MPDFKELHGVLDVAWSRRVWGTFNREGDRKRQELAGEIRGLMDRVLDLAPRAWFHLRDAEAEVCAPPKRGRGRPSGDRKMLDDLLREVGIASKDDRRLILRLIGSK